MVVHQCNVCFCEFNKKSTLVDHQNKKKPCKPKTEIKIQLNPNSSKINPKSSKLIQNSYNMDENTVTNTTNTTNELDNCCTYCGKNFYNNANLKKHIKFNCKVKKLDEEKKENIFNILLEKEKIEKELILKKFEEFQNKMDIILINNENLQKDVYSLRKTNKLLQNKIEEQNKKYDSKMKQIINKNITPIY
jgi:hypothetical protein